TINRQTSVVECREQLKLVGLLLVMIDEERRLVCSDQLPDFFHRCDRFCLIGIEGRNYAFLEIPFQMDDVAGQNDEARIREMNQQRLAAGSMPRRGNQDDAPVTEYVGITVDELKVLRGPHERQ